jgi:hypothetical protein
MIKIQALLTKRHDLMLDQFDQHWRRHAQLTLIMQRIRHLVQDARPAEANDLITSSYDGIPEVWFDLLGDALGLQRDTAYPERTTIRRAFWIVEGSSSCYLKRSPSTARLALATARA